MTTRSQSASCGPGIVYPTVWRWHFYAGLFCIPFVVVLAVSGAVYLFKPQVEAWLDRPYDRLSIAGPAAGAEAQVKAALAAVPGTTLAAYEVPRSPNAAVRVVVQRSRDKTRVYVHPETLQVLHLIHEDDRFMRLIFKLHGELLIGNFGSAIVELAASWTIVMIVTGLYLWWPRQGRGLAGTLYPRLAGGGRLFWRDLHAVTGVWISCFTLFLLVSGLPWAKVWGEYFKEARRLTGAAVVRQDWPVGAADAAIPAVATGGHGEHGTAPGHVPLDRSPDYAAIDRLVGTVAPLDLAAPVLISPPAGRAVQWTAKSETQNRPRRVTLTLDGATGAVLKREGFTDRHLLDRIVAVGVAAHEGQLFGWPNQLLGLLTACGLLLLVVSGVTMWWRRRLRGSLGAPPRSPASVSWGVGALMLLFGVSFPLFAASLILVLFVERALLRRIPGVSEWLGLA